MKKLELADIVIHASNNGLIFDKSTRKITKICDISFSHRKITLASLDNNIFYPNRILNDIKLVKRPMSDLVKPITHPNINGGEEFVPAELIDKITSGDEYSPNFIYIYKKVERNHLLFDYKLNRYNGVENGSFEIPLLPHVVSILQKLHFDYNDLIGQDLAIDINTIK